jgi:hypothetical protein
VKRKTIVQRREHQHEKERKRKKEKVGLELSSNTIILKI